MSGTAIWIAIAAVICVWLLIVAREIRYLDQTPLPHTPKEGQ